MKSFNSQHGIYANIELLNTLLIDRVLLVPQLVFEHKNGIKLTNCK